MGSSERGRSVGVEESSSGSVVAPCLRLVLYGRLGLYIFDVSDGEAVVEEMISNTIANA